MSEPDRKDLLVDRLLGELAADEARELSRAVASDPALAMEAAELRCLFDDLRGLTVEPSARIAVQVRKAVDRRVQLRQPRPGWRPIRSLSEVLRVAAVAAVVCVGALLGERFVWGASATGEGDGAGVEVAGLPVDPESPRSAGGPSADRDAVAGLPSQPRYLPEYQPRDPADRAPKPYKIFELDQAVIERFKPPFARFEESAPHDVWLCATNTVASLRQEFDLRLSPNLRRRAIRAAGGSVFLAARIETMAEEIAVMVGAALDHGDPTVQDIALSLRALMAGGSTLRIGDHHASVRRCSDWLMKRLPDLHGGELATALSGLMDVAVVSGPKLGRLIGEHASRLTESIIFSNNDHRPSMLNWQTTAAQLADAGQVLRLAPAFGMVNKEALLARKYLSIHLSERIDRSTAECPDLLAAQLFGFGDLIRREEIEHKLALWRPRDLVSEHFVTLHHVAWSRFPLRSGWADFQHELRSVAAIATPASLTDAAALLLTLAVSYAAPGSGELLAIAMR